MAMHQLALWEEYQEPDRRGIVDDLLPLDDYDFYHVSCSTGKDSVAMLLDLIDRGVDKKKILLVHQEVDGRREAFMDWPCTPSYMTSLAKHLGVKLSWQWRDGGIRTEMLKHDSVSAGVYYQDEGEEPVYLPTTNRATKNTRLMWPAKSGNMRKRWCSSSAKIETHKRYITNHPMFQTGTRENPVKILVLTGERRQESSNRAKYFEAEVHGTSSLTRIVHQYRSVIDWTEDQVWAKLREHNIMPHPAYYLGVFGRVSCMTCIFLGPDHWAVLRYIAPERFKAIADMEKRLNHTIDPRMTVEEAADRGSLDAFNRIPNKDYWVKMALSDSITVEDIRMDPWVIPEGAYKGCVGGPT